MREMRLAILFSGNGSNLENIYRKMQNLIIDSAKIKLNFALAVSSKESAFGITRCKNLGLKCKVVDYKKNKADFFQKIMQILRNAQIDLVILAGFMKILPPEFNANFRAINIHPSILPLFKGANAIKESFESDMKIAGVSVHFVSDELDGGALIAQDIIYKIEGESLESFERRIHELEYEIYPKAIIKAIQMANNSGNSQNLWENQTKNAESALDSAESQNLVKNNSCETPKTRPLRGAKNREEASSSASADFLLEAEKRGSPPKSEKRQLLGIQFKKFGGSGAGGAALLQEEKNNKENAESNAESNRDSSVASLHQNDKIMDCHADSANLLAMTENNNFAESTLDSVKNHLDSAPSKQDTNSSIADEFLGFCEASDENRTLSPLRKRADAIPKKSLRDDEFVSEQ